MEAPNIPDRDALKTLLASTTSSQIKAILVTAVSDTLDSQFEALSAIFSPLAQIAANEKHCVRCHKTFHENENGPEACTIPHNDEPVDTFGRDSDDEDDPMMSVACCGTMFTESDGHPDDPCIVTSHTTDPGIVVYYDDDAEEDTNHNVVKCSKKCGVFTKKRKGKGNGSSSRRKKVSIWGFIYM